MRAWLSLTPTASLPVGARRNGSDEAISSPPNTRSQEQSDDSHGDFGGSTSPRATGRSSSSSYVPFYGGRWIADSGNSSRHPPAVVGPGFAPYRSNQLTLSTHRLSETSILRDPRSGPSRRELMVSELNQGKKPGEPFKTNGIRTYTPVIPARGLTHSNRRARSRDAH